MKILHTVEFYHPSVGGMQEVVRQLSERLVKLGHEVTVATTCLPERSEKVLNGVAIEEFDVSGNMVRGLNGDVERYRDFLVNADFDVITNFAAQQWATDVMITILDQVGSCKVFVPTGFSGLYSPQYTEYFTLMSSWMKQYDANVFLSDDYRDINFARNAGVTKTILIPNGAGEDEFLAEDMIDIRQNLGIPERDFLTLHVGSHTGVKGHREALEIFRRAELSDATFLLVGNELKGGCAAECREMAASLNASSHFRAARKRILMAELSRRDTVAAYRAADLFLFPSNIECSPIVLFECMASRTPFMTTNVGNAAEIVAWSGGGVVMPTVNVKSAVSALSLLKSAVKYVLKIAGLWHHPVSEDFTASRADIDGGTRLLEELFADKSLRDRMAEAGYTAWQERFTWEKITRDYESLYYGLIKDNACS